jgi:hypothetical protein
VSLGLVWLVAAGSDKDDGPSIGLFCLFGSVCRFSARRQSVFFMVS